MTATPSTNPTLAHRTGGFDSLAAGLDYAAMGRTGCNFFSARGHLEQTLPYAELRDGAVDLALRLGTLGLARGTRIVGGTRGPVNPCRPRSVVRDASAAGTIRACG